MIINHFTLWNYTQKHFIKVKLKEEYYSNMDNYAKVMAAGAQLGSFQEQISRSPYSSFLGTEVAILQRKIYLPLLPQERIGYGVLKAYDYMAQEEMLPESEFHPKGYWFKEDVYADFYEGNFYVPQLFPQLAEAGVDPKEFESTLVKYNAAEIDFKGGELATDGEYVKGNYIKLKIPKYIALQFTSTIPRNTEFTINFTGGNSQVDQLIITGVKSIGEYDDPWAHKEQGYYPGLYEEEEELLELCDIIMNNLEAIEEEEESRAEENATFAEQEAEFFGEE